MKSMIKSDGALVPFFDRPIGGTLGVLTLSIWALIIGFALWNIISKRRVSAATNS